MNEGDSRRGDYAAVLLLLILGTLFFSHILFFGRSFYLRDLTRYYYPTKRLVREVMLSGEFPHWNRYYSAGQPMAANPEYEVFYPPQWLVLLPSYDLGFRLHIVFHVYAALLGMYLLLRSMELKRRASFFGALTFGLGGLFLSLVNLLPIMFCATWIPYMLMFTRRALMRRSVSDIAAAGLFGGLQILTAEPTTLIQTWFLIGMYALYRAWYSTRRLATAYRNLLIVMLVILSAALVGAVQLFPAFDHVTDSVRSRPFDYSLVTTWSMPFAKPLELIYPNVFGHMSLENVTWYWGGGMYPNTGSPFIYNIYCGLLVTALVIGALFVRPRGGRLVLAIVSASVLLALGGHTPLFKGLYAMGIGSIRYPEKFALMGVIALIIFGAQMLDRLLDGDRRLAGAALGFVLGAGGFALAIALFSFTPWFVQLFSLLWGAKEPQATYMAGIYRIDWWLAVARCSILAVLLVLARERRTGMIWFSILCVVTLLDLTAISIEINPTLPRNFFTPPPIVRQFASAPQDYRLFHEADWYGTTETAKKYFSTGNAVYFVVRNALFPMTPASWGFRTVLERDYDKTALLSTVDLVDSMWQVKNRGRKDWAQIFLAMSNGRYHGSFETFEDEKKRVGGKFRQARPVTFVDRGASPRYYFADQLEQIQKREQFIDKLASASWSRRVAFVSFGQFLPAAGRVLRVDEKNNEFALEVDAAGKAFLVASVTNHKYWRAFIDENPTPIEVVNIGYQGVIVPPGRHKVRFVYRNPIVLGSLWISAFSLLMSLAVMIRWRSGNLTSDAPEPHAGPDNIEEHSGRISNDAYSGVDRIEPFDGDLDD